ncbi:MAG: oligogalacturonate lyase family protein [Porphyromonadaceae bacterium]|nr:oligogalacturonate lyase family protein [Porphyromonadaceae bacterium]
MRKFCANKFIMTLFSVVILISSGCNRASKPESERKIFNDPETGNEIWQITTNEKMSNMPYFEALAFTHDDRFVVFKSWREEVPKLFRSDLETGVVSKISDHEVTGSYTIHPNGKEVWFISGDVLYAVDVSELNERIVFDLSELADGREVRFSALFTNDGNYTLVTFGARGSEMEVYRLYLPENKIEKVYVSQNGFSHPMINPMDPNTFTFTYYPDNQNDMSLPLEERARSWIVDTRTGIGKPFLMMPIGFRATHASWSSDGGRFFFFRKTVPGSKPVSICSINKQGEDFTVHYTHDKIKLGHGRSSRDMKWFISDSQDSYNNPLTLLNLKTGEARIVCWPNSLQAPKEGNPQEDHVHPSFSYSGRYVAYTSDSGTGIPQAFVIPIEQFLK